jgi:methionine aminotransferase
MQFESKLPAAGTTIFSVMSALAAEHKALNLSQGFPDFDCHPSLIDLASKYMKQGFNQYAPMPGTMALRECVSQLLAQTYAANYHPETEITITAGATQAIYTCMAAFINAGDEVILFEPAYDCYAPAILIHGAKPVYCTLEAPEFKINWEQVRQKITTKTRAIIINSPHNPSGTILSKEDLFELEKLVSNTNLLIFSDEVYEHMVFDQQRHESVARYASLRERSVIISSFGKTVHTTGWKIGYVAAPKALTAEFRKIHQYLVFVVNHPLQLALAEFLSDARHYRELRDFYQAKRDLFLNLTRGSKLKPLHTSGTYFQLMDYSAVSEEKDTDFAIRLTKEKKLAAIPLSVFYENAKTIHLLRFCFAKKEETLKKAAEIICSL